MFLLAIILDVESIVAGDEINKLVKILTERLIVIFFSMF